MTYYRHVGVTSIMFKLSKIISARVVTGFVIGSVLGLSGCSSIVDKHVEWEYVKPDVFPVVKAVGYAPISLQKGKSESQKMILAIRSSKLDAYRELAEQVYGHSIKGSTSVKGMVANNDTLKSKVSGLIRGAKVVKNYAVGDIYTTELHLDMKDVYALYQVSNKTRRMKQVRYY
ncbi:MAG: hypothetical protein ACI8WB_003999 [Phenylobacterium sp.]|jgi:hypothetical protein